MKRKGERNLRLEKDYVSEFPSLTHPYSLGTHKATLGSNLASGTQSVEQSNSNSRGYHGQKSPGFWRQSNEVAQLLLGKRQNEGFSAQIVK